MSGEYKQISVNVPVLKNYSVSRLKFRDQSYYKYHSNPKFLTKIEKKYGQIALDNVKKMNKIKLKRRLVEVMEQENK